MKLRDVAPHAQVLTVLCLTASVFIGEAAQPARLAKAQPSSASAATASTVTVKLSGFHGEAGVALVTLYDSEQNWLKVPKAVQVVRAKITGAAMTIELKDVKPGTYAVSVIHDENGNNKLDMRWLPWPKPLEGAAVSNDPDNKGLPPKWDAAKFTVSANMTVRATLKYPE